MSVVSSTVALLKPDTLRRRLVGQVLTEIETAGFSILAMHKGGPLTSSQLAVFYEEHLDRPYFEDLVTFMRSGPMVAIHLSKSGGDAVFEWRYLMGPSDPARRGPETIRGRYAAGCPEMENLVHGSDSPAAAARELACLRAWGCL